MNQQIDLIFIYSDLTHLNILKLRILITIILTALSCVAKAASESEPSFLSTGKWLKVHVDTTGVWRIPASMLSEWGLGKSDDITVAGFGSVEMAVGHTAGSCPVLPVMRHGGDIYFYGEGDRRVSLTDEGIAVYHNNYSQGSYYYVGHADGVRSPDIAEVAGGGSEEGVPVDRHTAIVYRDFMEWHPSLHGVWLYSNNITPKTPRYIRFNVDGHKGDVDVYQSYIWSHDSSEPIDVKIEYGDGFSTVMTEARPLDMVKDAQQEYCYRGYMRTTVPIGDDAECLEISVSNPDGQLSLFALRDITLAYERANKLTFGQMTMYFQEPQPGQRARIDNVNARTVIWDVTKPTNPQMPRRHDEAGQAIVDVPDGEWYAALVAFEPGVSVPVPQPVGEMKAQSLVTMDDADMLIVCTGATREASERLAALHEQWQGMRVAVVDQTEVFNEYSSGAVHPEALRLFVREMARRPRPVRYLLMMGQGTWDMRRIFDQSDNEYLVTFAPPGQTDQGYATRGYCTDLYFGITTPNMPTSLATFTGTPIVNVGRVPALTSVEAHAYVDKCEAYLSDPRNAGSFTNAMISGGLYENGALLSSAEYMGSIIDRLVPGATVYRGHLSLFPVDVNKRSEECERYYRQRWAGGDVRFFGYTGHGDVTQISNYMQSTALESGNHYGTFPIYYMASCNAVPIDQTDISLGRMLIFKSPGPIAVIGAGGEVFMSLNNSTQNKFAEMLFSSNGGDCIGDTWRRTLNNQRTSGDHIINNYNYNFLGDPAMPRYFPTHRVETLAVGETELVGGSRDSVSVSAGRPFVMSGIVTGSNGDKDVTFNGDVRVDIYAQPVERTTRSHVSGDPVVALTIDEELINSLMVPVKNGEWQVTVTMPPMRRDGVCRATLNAVSDDHRLAWGSTRAINMTEAAGNQGEEPIDNTAPEIRVWLETDGETAGTTVGASPVLHISASDDGAGVCVSGAGGMELAPRVTLDGRALEASVSLLRPSGEGVAESSFQLSGISDGAHTVTVSVADMAGNRGSEHLDFVVMNNDATARLEVSEPIARDGVTFTLEHSLPSGHVESRLLIRDTDGNTVLSQAMDSTVYDWDMTGADGAPVKDGVYRASVLLKAHPYYTHTPEVRFTIVKRNQ